MLQSLFHKVTGLQPSNFIKERLQRRYFPENIAKFLTTPFLKNICELMLLLIVIFLQENNRVQRCLDLPGPKLHKKLIFVMLVHSPQTTFHRKIIYNFVWIYLGKSSRSDVFCKKVFLGISQNSQENTCARASFLIKLQAFAKKEALVQVFSVNFVKYVIARFFKELLRWLLLSGPTLHKEITCKMLAYG